MKIATITHDATGCRIDLGTGSVNIYANISYVAESLAREQLLRIDEQKRIGKIRDTLNGYAKRIDDSDGLRMTQALIDDVRKILDEDVPF